MSDLTAKARMAAEWFNATQDKVRDTYETADLESDGWSVYTFYRYGKTAHDNSCRYDGMSDRMLIAFCEDRGWQDQEIETSVHSKLEVPAHEQEADGVEWVTVTETTTIGRFNVWLYTHDGQWRWDLQDINDNDAPVFSSEEMIPTREEARRQAVEAARGMNNEE